MCQWDKGSLVEKENETGDENENLLCPSAQQKILNVTQSSKTLNLGKTYSVQRS